MTGYNAGEQLRRYFKGSSTSEEKEILMSFLADDENIMAVKAAMEEVWSEYSTSVPVFKADASRSILQHILSEGRTSGSIGDFKSEANTLSGATPPAPPALHVHFLKTAWFRNAAILLLIAGTAAYLYRTNTPQKEIAKTVVTEKPTDILPGGNKAILTLSDGSTIVLDSAATGSLAQQGNMKIVKLDKGALAYQGGTGVNGEVLYNTISTPKGGQYQVTLPDGTKVWLNAASSITFPTIFVKERKVTMTGEVYMEVVKDKRKPFLVNAGELNVEVLGTSFNVNAYVGEPSIKTTLLQGAVKVGYGSVSSLLKPGQQLQIELLNIRQPIKVINNADTTQVMAWKGGLFNFDGVGIEDLMRQVERWYGIEVVYEKGIPDVEFVGKMSRNVSLNNFLRNLHDFDVHFRKEGNRLIILP